MNLIRKIVITICLIVFVGSVGIILDYVIGGIREQNALEDLSRLKTEQEDLITDKGTVIGKYVDLYLQNEDLIGWITMKDTKIDYPVMQTKDEPEYYLRKDFNRQYAISGTPFMAAESSVFVPTWNFLIYGHHMRNGTMFHDLLKYDDKNFYRKHKTFKFETIYKGGQGTYEVVAAGYSKIYSSGSKKFKYYEYAGSTSEEDFKTYISGIKALSVYDTNVVPKYGDQLVTLSTCAYHTENGRFFVVGRRTDAGSIKPQ